MRRRNLIPIIVTITAGVLALALGFRTYLKALKRFAKPPQEIDHTR